MKKNRSKELLFFEEESLSLKAIIAIDSTVLGAAMASTKLINYTSEEAAIYDALDTAYFNSLKAGLLKRSLGGASIILLGKPEIKSEMYFRALGIFLNRWNGKLFMTKSTGVSYNDVNHTLKETKFVLGLEESNNGLGKIAKSRAKGMLQGLLAIAKHKFDSTSLDGLKIVVQGVGESGAELVKLLIKQQAKITITDKIYDKIKQIQDKVNDIKVVRPTDVYKTKCDIFCSCASDKIILEDDAKTLNCSVLTGITNDFLQTPDIEELLVKAGILYVPGYVVNSGDIIQLDNEKRGYSKEKSEKEMSDIYYNTLNLIEQSVAKNTLISKIAVQTAESYISDVAAIKMLK